VNRAEQLHDQAEFLRSLAKSSSISSKRDQLLRAAEQCDALAAASGQGRAPKPKPSSVALGEPYLRVPARAH